MLKLTLQRLCPARCFAGGTAAGLGRIQATCLRRPGLTGGCERRDRRGGRSCCSLCKEALNTWAVTAHSGKIMLDALAREQGQADRSKHSQHAGDFICIQFEMRRFQMEQMVSDSIELSALAAQAITCRGGHDGIWRRRRC